MRDDVENVSPADHVNAAVPTRHTHLTTRRLRMQLIALGAILWCLAVYSVATPGSQLRSGQVKGADFVHFYTLAKLGAAGEAGRFADLARQRQVQLQSRPESIADWYPPAYGPQVVLLLSPLGVLSYGQALITWLAISVTFYGACCALVVRHTAQLRHHAALVTLAAVAFAPFWELVLHGQLSMLAVGAIVAGWIALRSGRPWLAGAAFGLLAYKLSLGVPLVAILLAAGAWRILAGALTTACGQIAIAGVWVGAAGLRAYLVLLLDSPRLAAILAAKPDQMHSWRAFWLLLVGDPRVANTLYLAGAACTIYVAARLWRAISDPSRRVAVLVTGVVLASPHLYVYDLVVLAPAWLWLTGWYLADTAVPAAFGRTLYAGFAAPLFGPSVGHLLHVQLSTLCLATVLVLLWRRRTGGATI